MSIKASFEVSKELQYQVVRGREMWIKVTGLLLCLLLWSCSAETPTSELQANPPTPPRELPSALVFPKSVAINVDTIRSGDSSNSAFIGEGGGYSLQISMGADLVYFLNYEVDFLLDRINEMEIPVSTDTTTFHENVTFDVPDDGPKDLSSIILTADIKIDFSDFDLDNDGIKEGCSGHTAATPICFRLWFNEKRLMTGIFTEFPTDENPGAGQIMTFTDGDDDDPPGDNFRTKIIYDHQDPENKSSEFFAVGEELSLISDFPLQGPFSFAEHTYLTQIGPEESAKKSINMHHTNSGSDYSNTAKYIGQWQEGNDYWSGSFLYQWSESLSAISGEFSYEESNLCAQISTGNEANQDNCTELGIDVTGIDFIDIATGDDVAFPDDFPESPTF